MSKIPLKAKLAAVMAYVKVKGSCQPVAMQAALEAYEAAMTPDAERALAIAEALDAYASIDEAEGGNPTVIETERQAARMIRDLVRLMMPVNADALEAAARAISIAKGLNPDALHYGTSDRDVSDFYDKDGKPFHFGWRNQVKYANAALQAAALKNEGEHHG